MMFPVSLRRLSGPVSVLLFLLSNFPSSAATGVNPTIVIGFVGGFVGRNNAVHGEVQLAKRLSGSSGMEVRMFENRHGREAHREILRLLDTDKNGILSAEEKGRARIAIYGHSWGGSETVTLARALADDHIPIALTVQVDSVRKPGEDDEWIPANVTEAINYYQLDGLLHGRSMIRAADASRTRILGNFELNYKTKPVSCQGYPWFARVFMKPHIEIESDPTVWGQVEALIRKTLADTPGSEVSVTEARP